MRRASRRAGDADKRAKRSNEVIEWLPVSFAAVHESALGTKRKCRRAQKISGAGGSADSA